MSLEMYPAVAAFLERDVFYLDGTRYYSEAGALRLKPRGRSASFRVSDDGAAGVFTRPNRPAFLIPFTDQVYGANDVWFSSDTPPKPPAHSAVYSSENVRAVTAGEWFEKIVDPQKPVVLDFKLALHPLGSIGGGRGKARRDANIQRVAYTDKAAGIKVNYLTVDFTNHRTAILPRDFEKGIMAPQIKDEGPYHKQAVIPSESYLYIAGTNYVFTDPDLAVQASELGLVGTPASDADLDADRSKFEALLRDALLLYNVDDAAITRITSQARNAAIQAANTRS